MIINFHEDVIAPVYRSYLDDYKRYNLFFGGASSGKSVFAVSQRPVLRCLAEDGRNFVILRKVDRTVKTSTFAEVKKTINNWGVASLFKENKTDQLLTCKNGNHMIFKGMDDPEKVKSITFDNGPVTDIIMEEATEFTIDDYKQCKLRMRGEWYRSKQLTLVFNPISALHWAKKEFFDVPKDSWKCSILKTTYLDNPFLDKEDIESIEEFKNDPLYWNVYGLGEWGIIGEIVFHNYVIEDFPYTVDDLENVSYGIDFGYHFSTLISIGWKDGEPYIFDEVYLKKKTNPEFIEHINDFGEKYKKVDIVADSAEPDRIKEFKKAGYRVRAAKKGPGTLKMGIDFLQSNRLHIHKRRCPNTANEIQIFQHRKDKDGNVLDEFIEINDHCIAGARYATEYLWGKFVPKVTIRERIG